MEGMALAALAGCAIPGVFNSRYWSFQEQGGWADLPTITVKFNQLKRKEIKSILPVAIGERGNHIEWRGVPSGDVT